MKMLWVFFFVFNFLWANAFADTIQMKSGEIKKGKVLRETDQALLFRPDSGGAIAELKKSDISIMERDMAEQKTGGLSFVSTVPKKESPNKDATFFQSISKSGVDHGSTAKKENDSQWIDSKMQNDLFVKAEALFQKWLDKNPQWKQHFEDIMKNMDIKSKEMDKLFKAAKES